MAKRRMGYGTAPMPSMKPGGFPLPPPPDGKPAVRLPIGGGRREMAPPQPAPVVDETGQSDEAMLQMLLKQLGGRPDAM